MIGIILQITQHTAAVNDTIVNAANKLATSQPTEETLSIWELVTMRGSLWIIIPLLAFSIIAVYIFIERYLAINKASGEELNFMNNIRDFMHNDRIDSAKSLCKNNNSPISNMIEKGILRIGRPLNDINAAIENIGQQEIAKLERKLPVLAMIAGASPMLGFLGTVTGMVTAFYNMSKAGNNVDISTLSGGIYQAMITTIAGLIVGIIAYIFYNILVARIEKIVFILQTRATEFMDILNEPTS